MVQGREEGEYLLGDEEGGEGLSEREDNDHGPFERLYVRGQPQVTHARGYHEFSEEEKIKMGEFESLDFGVIDNQILREFNRKTTHFEHMLKTFGKWFICFNIGVMTGIIAYGIKYFMDHIVEFKLDITNRYIRQNYYIIPGLIYMGLNMALVILSVLVIFLVGPLGAGSGIPEVKGYLNGVRIPGSLNIKTLFGKIVSLMLSYSSGLFLGPEGPMVHIGAMVGSAVGQMKSKTLKIYPKIFWRYHNYKDRRDFISTGAAAGIAAAFGAPIGGVLFSIEEASSFWSRQLTWRTFFGCLIATFTVNLFFQGFGIQIHDFGLLTFGFSQNFLYTYLELIPFATLGVIGGLLGAAFVWLTIRLVNWRDAYLGKRKSYRLVDAVLLIMLTSSVTYGLAALVPCRPLSGVHPPASSGASVCNTNETKDSFVQMFCPDTYYSDMASLIFAPLDSALNLLFSRSRGVFALSTIIIYAVMNFFLAVSTTGVWVASGLFVPTMIVGGAVGRVMGELMAIYFDNPTSPIDPSIYAMIGSASLMAGSTRMTISLVVIIIELTEGTQFLLPVILSVMIGKWVGDIFNESVYEHLMEQKCFPYLPSAPPQTKSMLTVMDVMITNVITLQCTSKVADIIDMLQSNKHNGFPVVAKTQDGRYAFHGLILRSQLIILLEHKVFFRKFQTNDYNFEGGEAIDEPGIHLSYLTSPTRSSSGRYSNIQESGLHELNLSLSKKIEHEEFTHCLAKKLVDAGSIPLTTEEREMYIDLRPYMNLSPTMMRETTSFSEAYHIFRTMGLRHLVIVDSQAEVSGIITRKDLL